MVYLFLSIALFAGVTKGYCGKKTSSYTTGFRDAILANTLRMLICIVIGFVLILPQGGISMLKPTKDLILISALSGISTSVFVVTWLVSVRKSAFMMVDIFLIFGTLIPIILSNVMYGEKIRLTQYIGIGILFIAVILMCSYNNALKGKITLPAFLLLILCGTASGFADFSQKLLIKTLGNGSVSAFNFYTYVFATVTLIIAFFLARNDGKATDIKNLGKMSIYILIMAICLFVNSYFKTLAASSLSSVILYPLNQGMSLVLSSAMAAIVFKERLTLKAIIGIFTAFAGLLIINLL